MMNAPGAAVLLITFNRPDNAAKVFEKIREAKIQKLFVFNDGPRPGNASDALARLQIKQLVEGVDWPCEVRTHFPAGNLGCGPGVSEAISWAFLTEDRIVILEDDCVPVPVFFTYCNDLLERYKTDTRIWMISGNNYNEEYAMTASYTFSRNAIHIWGWATWKRCWEEYDYRMQNWPEFYSNRRFRDVFSNQREASFWIRRYTHFYSEHNRENTHTWDYQFVLSILMNGGLVIVPARNLVTNIGYEGVHTNDKNWQQDRAADADFEIRTHPRFVLAELRYDHHHFRNHWNKRRPFLSRLRRKGLKLLNMVLH